MTSKREWEEALKLATLAIEKDDNVLYDVAANMGQIVGNVKHTSVFHYAVADWILEEGISNYQHLKG